MNVLKATIWRWTGSGMLVGAMAAGAVAAGPTNGWLAWRGPQQSGVSLETGLPSTVAPEAALWVADFPGASTPVIADGRLYVMGYAGEGPGLQEGLACFDANSGEKLWQHLQNDFLSDIIYNRYATANPAIDAGTGNVYIQGTQGLLSGFTADGRLLWQRSLMESYGRLTFPNGRTATPVIDGDLVITHGITANWGAHGPGGDRFYAFDKQTGELVWASTPGDRPRDSSYSYPTLGWLGGRRVLYCSIGDGSIVCVNARTGQPIWRVPVFRAGINASVVVHNDDKVVAVFGTPYEPGEMVAIRIKDVHPAPDATGPVEIPLEEVKLWSNDISSSTSSPILVGDRIYAVAEKGDLCAVDANTGEILWKIKLGIEQRNSCPLYADGKLYVPLLDDPAGKGGGRESEAGTSGAFYIIEPGDRAGRILSHVALDGRCFGSPTVYNGKVYVQTTRKLYCFGKPGENPGLPPLAAAPEWPAPGPAAQLQIIPAEVALHPGQTVSFRVRQLDARGFTVAEADPGAVKWAPYIPPTAKVRATMKAEFNPAGQLVAAPEPVPSAGAFEAALGDQRGYIRGRVLPAPPVREDFESFQLTETTPGAQDSGAFAYPPLPWIGARFKFEVREREGSQVLAKTIDNKFFQRATVFIGTPEMSNYTIQADVLSDGNRRKMSEVGLINQRYYIVLKGNDQKVEINSNLERLRVPAVTDPPNFRWRANEWYRLKARVDVAEDGSGVVRAKAWKRDEPEPEAWTLEVPHRTAHRQGAPGLFGFSPQDMKVYIDNVQVTPN